MHGCASDGNADDDDDRWAESEDENGEGWSRVDRHEHDGSEGDFTAHKRADAAQTSAPREYKILRMKDEAFPLCKKFEAWCETQHGHRPHPPAYALGCGRRAACRASYVNAASSSVISGTLP